MYNIKKSFYFAHGTIQLKKIVKAIESELFLRGRI